MRKMVCINGEDWQGCQYCINVFAGYYRRNIQIAGDRMWSTENNPSGKTVLI